MGGRQKLLGALITALLFAGLVGLGVVDKDDRASPAAAPKTTTTAAASDEVPPETTSAPSAPPADDKPAPTTAKPVPTYSVTGRIVDGANRPAAGVPVVMAPDSGLIDIFITIFAVLSLGAGFIACILPDVCGKGAVQTITDNSGRFEFKVPAEVAGKSVILTAQRNEQASSARSSRKHKLTGTNQDLGAMPLWEPRLTFGSRGASWSPVPPNGGKPTLELRDAGEGRLYFEASGGSVTYDARLLEDLRLSGRVRAKKDGLELTSPEYAVGGPGVPLSRGRPCVVSDPDAAVLRNDCPWTAGRLEPAAHLEPAPNGRVLDIDLGSERTIGYLVLRGLDNLRSVEVSSDRNTWRPVSTQPDFKSGEHLGATLAPGARGRWVRVRLSGFDTAFLDEVGLWP